MTFPVDVSLPNERCLSTHGAVMCAHVDSKMNANLYKNAFFHFSLIYHNNPNINNEQSPPATEPEAVPS